MTDLEVHPLRHPVGVTHDVFTGEEGGYPLRCCLRDSRAGESLALVAVSPDGPEGAYRETGPVFVHADPCDGPDAGYPADFRSRDQVFRAYGHDGSIVGAELVVAGDGQEDAALALLRRPDVAFVHSRNVLHGCYMFEMRLGPQRGPAASSREPEHPWADMRGDWSQQG